VFGSLIMTVRWKHEEYRRYPLASLPRIRSCVRMAASNRSSRFLGACSAAKRAAPPSEDEFRPRGVHPLPAVGGSPPISFGRIDLSAGNGDRRICAGRIENKISSVIDTNGVVIRRNQIPEDVAAFSHDGSPEPSSDPPPFAFGDGSCFPFNARSARSRCTWPDFGRKRGFRACFRCLPRQNPRAASEFVGGFTAREPTCHLVTTSDAPWGYLPRGILFGRFAAIARGTWRMRCMLLP